MQFKTLIIATIVSAVAAQTSTTTKCAAQNILDACIGTIQGQINSCSMSDYSCLCTQYINMLTCYNNCPNDLGVGTVQSLREQNCINASVYGTTSTHGNVPASTASTSTTTTSSESAAETGFSSGTRSATGSSSSQTSSSNVNSADSVNAGGVLALFVAGVAALL